MGHPAPKALDSHSHWGAFRSPALERHSRPRYLAQTLRVDQRQVVYPSGGTVSSLNDPWMPVATYVVDPAAIMTSVFRTYQPDLVVLSGDSVILCEVKVGVPGMPGIEGFFEASLSEPDTTTLPESANVAREVRDLSGLSAEKLGEIFPIERESYQRWISGKTSPSEANLERLLALRHFFRAVADRVTSPKSWLLAPLTEGSTSSTPYDLLRAGDFSSPWDAITRLPNAAKTHSRQSSDGSTLTVVEGSLRGRDLPTSAEELDDYDDWLSEDE